MATTYIVPEVPGYSRKSDRPYTHALVGRRNLAAMRAEVLDRSDDRIERKNFEYTLQTLATGVGKIQPGRLYPCTQDDVDRAQALIDECPTFEAYIAREVARRLNGINSIGTGDEGPLVVLQWSMSQLNAMKGEGQYRKRGYIGIRVVECVPVVKAPKTVAPA